MSWRARTAPPSDIRRRFGSALRSGRYVHIIGGVNSVGAQTAVHEMYDLETDTWDTLASHPVSTFGMAAVASDSDTIYTFGGDSAGSVLRDIYRYRKSTNTWTLLAAQLPAARGYMAAATIGANVYLHGGRPTSDVTAPVATLWKFVPATEAVPTALTSSSIAKKEHGVAVVSGKMIVFGGQTAGTSSASTSVESYDPATNAWTVKTSVPIDSASLFRQTLAQQGNEVSLERVTASTSTFPVGTSFIYNAATDTYAADELFGIPIEAGIGAWRADGVRFVLGGPTVPGVWSDDGVDLSSFTGTDATVITPAPEKLPHMLDYTDFPGLPESAARALARKLQDNFDSVERQLLALDPDNQGNKNPIR